MWLWYCWDSIMPPAVTDSLDIWAVDSQIGADGSISVDFLLPTGIYINLDVPRDATISHIKQVIPNGQLTYNLECVLFLIFMCLLANEVLNLGRHKKEIKGEFIAEWLIQMHVSEGFECFGADVKAQKNNFLLMVLFSRDYHDCSMLILNCYI